MLRIVCCTNARAGNLQRIQDNFKEEDFVVFTIKHIRNDLRHDLEHGDAKEIDAKNKRLVKIYKRYSSKTAFAALNQDDFSKVQLLILEELKEFLIDLKLCWNDDEEETNS